MVNDLDTGMKFKEIKPRDHLCLIYKTEQEWQKSVALFIKEGLEHGEKCLYIYNTHQPEKIKNSLAEEGVDLGGAEQFIFYNFNDFYKNSEADIYSMIYFLMKLTETSISQGYSALRMVMEVNYSDDGFNSVQILEFEARLNRYLFSKYPCAALCLYGQKEYGAQVLKDVIITHPFIIKNESFYRNSHYIIPAGLISREREKNEIDHLLNNIEQDYKNNESINFLSNVFKQSLQAFCSLSVSGSIVICNQAFCKLTGYSREQLYSKSWGELIFPEYYNIYHDARQKAFEEGNAQRYEAALRGKDNQTVHAEILMHYSGQGRDNEYYCIFMNDITERKQMEKALTESKQNFEAIIDFLPDPTLAIDKEGEVIAWNRAMEKMTGVEAEKALGQGDHEYAIPIYGRKRPMLIDHVLDSFNESSYYNSIKKEGQALIAESFTHSIKNREMFLWCKATPLYNSQGELAGAIESIRDITEFKLNKERLRFLSQRDGLTGLYNRSYFEEELQKLETDNTFLSGAVGIIVCNLDGLKEVNDTLGHQKGDELLTIAARLIREPFREDDLIARIGGDEFVVLLPNSPIHAVERASQRIRQMVERYNNNHPQLPLSISVGFAVSSEVERNLKKLFMEADDNMYREKLHHKCSPRSAVVYTLMKALEARDFITEGHADRLQKMVAGLGRNIGLPEYNLNDLRLLAQFHDIGKIGIADRILFKPGILNVDEMAEMRRHCEIGYQIAQAAPALAHISDWILKHHEWWDGSGYPLGLKKVDIPLECRILSIVDAYDAMTSDRPYRKAIPHHQALKELKRCAGTQFDPNLVNKFADYSNRL